MILGNAGIVTVIISATSSLVISKGYNLPISVFLLLIGIVVIYKIGTSKGFIMRWENFIEKKFLKLSAFEEDAVEDLLHFLEGYGLVRSTVKKGSPLDGISLSECKICKEGILVLGIERGKNWVPIPQSNETLKEGDRLVVYGHLDTLKTLFREG